ncbi:poly-gamma-glutamate hydrolase family protein, partial [Polymorphospora rubra]
MADLYASYAELAAAETEGVDYSRTVIPVTGATWASIAIHGGGIERGSGEMARAVGDGLMSVYEFAGLKTSGNQDLHITSTNFDEPLCTALVGASQRTLSFHGYVGTTGVATTALGGLDADLVARVRAALEDADFAVVDAPSEIAGTDPANICNQNARSAGVQLEMSRALRDSFFPGGATSAGAAAGRLEAFWRYVRAVRSAYIGTGRISAGV